MSPFEAGMIVCFGISWPVAIAKTLKTRSVHGKSRMFLLLVLSGYGLGILHKVLYSLDLVVLLYAFNFTMVLIEVFLWFRYRETPLPALAATEPLGVDCSAADTLLAEAVRVQPSGPEPSPAVRRDRHPSLAAYSVGVGTGGGAALLPSDGESARRLVARP